MCIKSFPFFFFISGNSKFNTQIYARIFVPDLCYCNCHLSSSTSSPTFSSILGVEHCSLELEEHSCDQAEDTKTVDRHFGSMNSSWIHKMSTDLILTFSNSWHPLALEPKNRYSFIQQQWTQTENPPIQHKHVP